MRSAHVVVCLLLASGCSRAVSTSPAPPVRPAPPAVAESVPGAIHWTRSSAEYRALLLQTYGWAGERLQAAVSGRVAGTWAVILDADETVLDNSTYQKERAEVGGVFTRETWEAWVRREEAPAVPGAAGFIRLARELGGRVVLVTNRDEVVCGETRRNLAQLGIVVDGVLCRQETSDKNGRFDSVRSGSAVAGLPALEVVMWVGDNILDFPGLTQAVGAGPDSALAEFGRRFIVVPNVMYGSWETNPVR